MKYFLYANTEKKPVMRFFDHWFEVSDFLSVMKWSKPDPAHGILDIEIYRKMDEEDLNDRTEVADTSKEGSGDQRVVWK